MSLESTTKIESLISNGGGDFEKTFQIKAKDGKQHSFLLDTNGEPLNFASKSEAIKCLLANIPAHQIAEYDID